MDSSMLVFVIQPTACLQLEGSQFRESLLLQVMQMKILQDQTTCFTITFN